LRVKEPSLHNTEGRESLFSGTRNYSVMIYRNGEAEVHARGTLTRRGKGMRRESHWMGRKNIPHGNRKDQNLVRGRATKVKGREPVKGDGKTSKKTSFWKGKKGSALTPAQER